MRCQLPASHYTAGKPIEALTGGVKDSVCRAAAKVTGCALPTPERITRT